MVVFKFNPYENNNCISSQYDHSEDNKKFLTDIGMNIMNVNKKQLKEKSNRDQWETQENSLLEYGVSSYMVAASFDLIDEANIVSRTCVNTRSNLYSEMYNLQIGKWNKTQET